VSEHKATILWSRGAHEFGYETYSRDHTWRFDGGALVAASATPSYKGNPACVDPEEAFVAALSSCHMLTFLAIAARKRLVVDRYEDAAIGFMEKNEAGRLAITRVELRPRITFGGTTQPSAEDVERMHHQAHEHCFIANSVKTDVRVLAA
jgi:organic hydroperoxide reductase OsmC/OhrA